MSYKDQVVAYAKKCFDSGLTVGTSGNVSLRVDNLMYITPSALPYNQMMKEDVLVVDLLTGDIVEGKRNPSSETPMHSNIYKGNSDVEAIVHTHSSYATMFACAHMPIPPVHYTIADIGREVPVAGYARYGSEKLAQYAVEKLEESGANGVLLANHGVVAVGNSLDDAYRRAETIEEVAELAYGSKLLGGFITLTDEELDEALEGFKTYVSG